MNVAEIIVKYLEDQGVEYIFGIPGGALEPLNTALYQSKIKVIVTKHEQGAAFMADGYARATGKIGVCCSTAGPGATNMTTSLATSYSDSIPVLALTAQVATSLFGKGAVQEFTSESLSIVSMFSKITKYSDIILHEGKTREMLAKAFRTALSGRTGPVHLNLPNDIMKRQAPENAVKCNIERSGVFDRERVKEAAGLLLKAKRPVILAGWGAVLSRADKEVLELAEMMNIPVCTSPKAKGIVSESHRLSLGVFGFAGSLVAREYILGDSVDVMLAVGTSFNEWMTAGWDKRIAPSKAMIQIDIDYNEMDKNYPLAVGIMGDAKVVLTELLYEVRRQAGIGKKWGNTNSDYILALHEKNTAMLEKSCRPSSGGLYKPQCLIKDLMESLPVDSTYFVDIGNIMAWSIHYLNIERPYSFYLPLGFATMGFGAAACIGAKLAVKDKPVIAIVGDGGFLMNGAEVATAVNYNIPVIWVVMNNSMLGMIHHGRKMASVPEGIPSKFQRVDFVKLAEGYGAKGIRIDKPGEINKKMMTKIIASGKPTVLDVIIDPKEVPPIKARVDTLEVLYK
jgi:acetolactate synthase-1/2/3 large subunit